jgi:carbamoyltransferase
VLFANKWHFVYRLFGTFFRGYEHDFFSWQQKAYLYYHYLLKNVQFTGIMSQWFNRFLVSRKIGRDTELLDHHTAHAYSAYYSSGFKEALAITVDNMGDGYAVCVFDCRENRVRRLRGVSTLESPGQFYGEITQYFGFNPLRHAGKVTGLAAHGDPEPAKHAVADLFDITEDKKHFTMPSLMHKSINNKYYKALQGFTRENIAAATQRQLEDTMLSYIAKALEETELHHVVLAGGVFGNVLLNKKTAELPGVKGVHVHPGMSDCGLSVGVGYEYLSRSGTVEPVETFSVYLGPEYTAERIQGAIESAGIEYAIPDDLVSEVAELLASGKVVAHFDGRMEYGPRALGNRSILYQTTDPSVNDWLNARLKRTEFMPFAPITLEDSFEKCYHPLDSGYGCAPYMTICFDCTDYMKEVSPGVVHKDGTARPQIVSENTGTRAFDILQKYYEITGIPSLINTSFNMHEEPIVCSPEDAVRSFLQGHLDYLAIGPFLVKLPGD